MTCYITNSWFCWIILYASITQPKTHFCCCRSSDFRWPRNINSFINMFIHFSNSIKEVTLEDFLKGSQLRTWDLSTCFRQRNNGINELSGIRAQNLIQFHSFFHNSNKINSYKHVFHLKSETCELVGWSMKCKRKIPSNEVILHITWKCYTRLHRNNVTVLLYFYSCSKNSDFAQIPFKTLQCKATLSYVLVL